MKNKHYNMIIVIALTMLTFVMAQDPPDLPGPPNQGPIGGLVWFALSGGLLALKKYLGNKKL